MEVGRTYICIDLKSFYASVECVARGLDPFTTNLVVADPERSSGTICLAITPAMKELGVRNRCRVFEIPPEIDYIMARPRMKRYMEVSADIYSTYLRYIAPEDIHPYSIDECFIDVTPYLALYGRTPREMAVLLMDAVYRETGICATAGIGTNLFLAKVALDITAKHTEDHIGFLDEEAFKATVWHHQPITDIWNIGPGIARRLQKYGVDDLAGVAALDPELLYMEFGVNAEFLIDHAWGRESCTIAQIQAYVPQGSSMTNGQVLMCDYTYDEAHMVMKEMVNESALELVGRGMVATSIGLMVGYASRVKPAGDVASQGEHGTRYLGAEMASGSRKLSERTSSYRKILAGFEDLWNAYVDPRRSVRRVNITFGGLMPAEFEDFTLFDDMDALESERDLAKAMLAIKGRFGKNALVKGVNLHERSTGRDRNDQVGGHRG